MRDVSVALITKSVSNALKEVNLVLPPDVCSALQIAQKNEKSVQGKAVLQKLLLNAQIAEQEKIPICQDTGMAVIFVDVGQDVRLIDGDLTEAINQGVAEGYQDYRKSIVQDPLQKNSGNNTPAVIYANIVPGDKLIINLMAKGGGAENKSKLKMFNPTVNLDSIKEFVLSTVKEADASACPPIIVGIGIGGTFDYCTYLAKKALLRPIGINNPNDYYKQLEKDLLADLNKLNIGPAGYGGTTTALAVNIEHYPCHIASLPVAVNIQCHASRHKQIII